MALRQTVWPSEPSGVWYISTSRKGSWPSLSVSMVNLIFSWTSFRWSRKPASLPGPCRQMNVSST
jgi:hypothetical protein